MNPYQHILLPTNFSASCNKVAQKILATPLIETAQITVLHVITYIPPTYVRAELPSDFSSEQTYFDKAREHLKTWCSDQKLTGCNMVVESGSAKRVIIETAKILNSDLILLGAGEVNLVTQAFGSVTGAVTYHAPCDVLIVR